MPGAQSRAQIKSPLKVMEAGIERAVTDILQYDGWRSFKMELNWSERKMKSVGEAGMPDRLYLRYGVMEDLKIAYRQSIAEVLWIEHKRVKGKASVTQQLWHAAERKRGALTLIAGQDFEASVEGFIDWYKSSGLMRRKW